MTNGRELKYLQNSREPVIPKLHGMKDPGSCTGSKDKSRTDRKPIECSFCKQLVVFLFFSFLVILGFELRALCFLGRHSTT
jgi:hypothetical protein